STRLSASSRPPGNPPPRPKRCPPATSTTLSLPSFHPMPLSPPIPLPPLSTPPSRSSRPRVCKCTPNKPPMFPVVPDPIGKRYRRPLGLSVVAHQRHLVQRVVDSRVRAELEGLCYSGEALATPPS